MKGVIRTIWRVIVASLLLASCSLPLTKEARLTEEAKAWAKQQIEAELVKCDDSYYIHWIDDRGQDKSVFFVEFKGLDVTAWVDELSEADRANGVEWRGTVQAFCTMRRDYVCHSYRPERCGWGLWSDSGGVQIPDFTTWRFTGTRVKGLWYLEPDPPLHERWISDTVQRRPFTCADIPK